MNDDLSVGLRGFKTRDAVIPILKRTGLHWFEVVARTRGSHVVSVRQEIFFVLRSLGYSYPRIGEICKRDHTTIIHGVAAHKEKLNEERDFYS